MWSTSKGPEDPHLTQANPSLRSARFLTFLQFDGRLTFLKEACQGFLECTGQGLVRRHFVPSVSTEQIDLALGMKTLDPLPEDRHSLNASGHMPKLLRVFNKFIRWRELFTPRASHL